MYDVYMCACNEYKIVKKNPNIVWYQKALCATKVQKRKLGFFIKQRFFCISF